MTSEQKRQFENQWPEVAKRLQGLLARRGIPIDRREDIVQETGLRLLASWDRVDAARPLWPFTITIALNLMRDQARRGLDSEVPTELPDRRGTHDVEATSLARLEVKRAGLALARMKAAHRDVLLAEIEPDLAPPKGSKAATKMLRMRARRKLSLMMQQVSALGVAPLAWIKRSLRFGDLSPFKFAGEGVFASALCGVLCAVTIGSVVSLAPFSSLPAQEGGFPERADAADESASQMVASFAGADLLVRDHSSARSGSSVVIDQRQKPGRESAASPQDADEPAVEQGGSYEVPLGGRTLIEGDFLVTVFTGGGEPPKPTDPPTMVDCAEHIVSPEGVDATCWDQRDPSRRYGVKVKHEGKHRVREAVSGLK